MKKDTLSDAIGQMDDGILEETLQRRATRPRPRYRWMAVVACVCVLAGCLLALPLLNGTPSTPPGFGTPPEVGTPTDYPPVGGQTSETTNPEDILPAESPVKYALAQPAYPVMVPRPASMDYDDAHDAWRDAVYAQRDKIKGQTDGMRDFYLMTMKAFLGSAKNENRVYSPLNVYLALSMLAETANGNSRTQLLKLLGVSDLSALRTKSNALWNGVYLDDGAALCRLSNSLWLADSDRWSYNTATVDRLAKEYYASVFRGDMASPAYSAALPNWINEQTNGLLSEPASDLKFDPDTAMALASTVCLRMQWTSKFSPETTQDGKFMTASGEEVSCRYLSRNDMDFAYFGDNFTAINLQLDDGGYNMYFIRPENGACPEDLSGDPQLLSTLLGGGTAEQKYLLIDMQVPKFDISSDYDLVEGLQAVGVTAIFDDTQADFSGILTEVKEPVCITQAKHAARVAIDEEGVTAAAYTVMALAGTGAPTETLQFHLDRPFMFAITGPGNTILFTGVVQDPSK